MDPNPGRTRNARNGDEYRFGESARAAAYRQGYNDGLAGHINPDGQTKGDGADAYQRGYADGDAALLA